MKEFKIELRDPSELIPYELNSKIHDEKQIKKIAKSITEFGFDQPIVVDVDGVIIKGHGRRAASIHLGLAKVPVLVRHDLTPEQVRAARLADNRVALSGIDTDMLQKELESLEFDLKGIFDDKELNFMSVDLGEINTSGFVEDLDIALEEQAAETTKKLETVAKSEIKLENALGFKSIKGEDEKIVVRFMAIIEAQTGLAGRDAFVKYATNTVKGI